MRLVRFLPFVLCAILVGLFGFTLLFGKTANSSPLVGKPLPHFYVMNSLNPREPFTAKNMQRPALLVFWASWCGICRVDLPVVSKFAADNNIPLYGIAYRDQTDALNAVMSSFKGSVTFTALGRDDSGTISSQYGLIGVPTLFLIDKDGIIRHSIAGQSTLQELNNDIRPLLQ